MYDVNPRGFANILTECAACLENRQNSELSRILKIYQEFVQIGVRICPSRPLYYQDDNLRAGHSADVDEIARSHSGCCLDRGTRCARRRGHFSKCCAQGVDERGQLSDRGSRSFVGLYHGSSGGDRLAAAASKGVDRFGLGDSGVAGTGMAMRDPWSR